MLKKTLVLFLTFSLSTSLIGCGGNEFASADQARGAFNTPSIDEQSCEVPVSKYKLNTEVVSLVIESRRNGFLGFSSDFFKLFGLNFRTQSGRLSLEMNIEDSINPDQDFLANGSGSAEMSKRDFRFDFDINIFRGSFGSYSETPLAELARQSLDSTLNDLRASFQDRSEEWNTVVQAVVEDSGSTEVVISSGRASNLKPGDVLAFYNNEHIWEGEPCISKYIFARRTSEEPIAFGTVTTVRNHKAQLKIEAVEGAEEVIALGAEGVVHQLNTAGRTLRQSISISSIKNSNLKFEGSQTAELAPYLERQIRGLAAEKGFVIYND